MNNKFATPTGRTVRQESPRPAGASTESIERIQRARFWLSVIANAIMGGAYLAGLIGLVYFLGSLAEGLRQ